MKATKNAQQQCSYNECETLLPIFGQTAEDKFIEHNRECIHDKSKRTIDEIIGCAMEELIEKKHPRITGILSALQDKKSLDAKNEGRKNSEIEEYYSSIFKEAKVMTVSTYSRMKKQNHNVRLSQIVSVCVFLGMDLANAEIALAAAGFTFRKGNILHSLYAFLIKESHKEALSASPDKNHYKYNFLMEECNEFLSAHGINKKNDLLGIHEKKL